MTFDIILLLIIVSAALVLFVSGWLRVDLVGLMVLSALALSGLVTAREALDGFSSPAVVTVWAMFILSAGLTRTGIAQLLGQPLQGFAKSSEIVLTAALMVSASLLSALINTVTVAAILLPAVMEVARRSGRPPGRLLMPLAMGCLLGGPFTGISTPPNILATDALRAAGLRPFGLFEFTPITAALVAAGILFMLFIGRHLLPQKQKTADSGAGQSADASYKLETHIFTTRIPSGSALDGHSLAESRLGSALYLTVVALKRKGALMLAPGPDKILQADDILIVHGRQDHLKRFHGSQHLQVESGQTIDALIKNHLSMGEAVVSEDSPMLEKTLEEIGLRRTHQVHVLALHDSTGKKIQDVKQRRLAKGDRLLLEGEKDALEILESQGFLTQMRFVKPDEANTMAESHNQMLPVRVPAGSVLAGHDLVESRLGGAFGLTVVGILREDNVLWMPQPQEIIQPEDVLILQGSPRDLEVLEGLQELTIKEQAPGLTADLESQQIGVTEVLLSPRTTLAGRTLADLMFREHYGISVLAIWRKGRAYRSGLQYMPLQFGDALLVYGSRRNLELVARDRNFIILDKTAARAPRLEKAHAATIIMLAVLVSAIAGIAPIAIAALTGATLMVLFGCLSMEEAYQAIEWKVVFLIASMLPLGAAIENTGAAQLGASALVSAAGDMGPRWVVAALFSVTVIGTQVIPTAALVVLMAPVALNAAASLGISPHLLMMTVAIAASSSFASPLSHPAHLLVMGPGGYKFMDYVKVGAPLTLVSLIVSVVVLPVLWPPY